MVRENVSFPHFLLLKMSSFCYYCLVSFSPCECYMTWFFPCVQYVIWSCMELLCVGRQYPIFNPRAIIFFLPTIKSRLSLVHLWRQGWQIIRLVNSFFSWVHFITKFVSRVLNAWRKFYSLCLLSFFVYRFLCGFSKDIKCALLVSYNYIFHV